MQVQEISQSGLKREIKITVAAADLEGLVTERLAKIAQTATIQGFRPGKAPMTIIAQRYSANVRVEVLDEAVSSNLQTALDERKWRPATQPKIDLVEMGEGKDLEFKAEVEILPEIKLTDFTKLSLEKPVIEVTDKEVDDAIVRIAKQVREPQKIEEVRPAKMGDFVVIDFDGAVNGDHKPGMKAEGHKLELGSHAFIDTFEDQIVGLKAGDSKDIKVTFPKDYHAKDLAGQKAVFAVTLKEIHEPKPITIDEELATEMGFKALEDLRKRVKEEIAADYGKGARAVLKRKLLDQLSATHKFDVPPSLLSTEFEGIWKQVQRAKETGQLSDSDKKKSDEALRKEYEAIAERRIRLGLVLAEVGQTQKLEVSGTELRNAMLAEARRFPGQEQAVFDYYTKTEGAMERLRAPILEEKTVDYILSQATLTDRSMTAEALTKLMEEEEE